MVRRWSSDPDSIQASYKAISKHSTQNCIYSHALERIASGTETNPQALAAEALHLAKHCKEPGFWPYFKHQTIEVLTKVIKR